MEEESFITIQEAVIYSNKSEKTIRNLVNLLVSKNKGSGKVTSKDTRKILVKKNGSKFFYLLSKEYLDKKFSSKNTGNRNETASTTTSNNASSTINIASKSNNEEEKPFDTKRNTVEILLETIEFFKAQLQEKDRQVKSLLERQGETNILLKGLQEKVFLLEEGRQGSEYDQQRVIYQDTQKQREEWLETDLETGSGVEGETDEFEAKFEAKKEIERISQEQTEKIESKNKTLGVEQEEVNKEECVVAGEEQLVSAQGLEPEMPLNPEWYEGVVVPEAAVWTEGEVPATAEVFATEEAPPPAPENAPPPDAGSSAPASGQAEPAAPVPVPVSADRRAGEGNAAALPVRKKKGFWRRVFGG